MEVTGPNGATIAAPVTDEPIRPGQNVITFHASDVYGGGDKTIILGADRR